MGSSASLRPGGSYDPLPYQVRRQSISGERFHWLLALLRRRLLVLDVLEIGHDVVRTVGGVEEYALRGIAGIIGYTCEEKHAVPRGAGIPVYSLFFPTHGAK